LKGFVEPVVAHALEWRLTTAANGPFPPGLAAGGAPRFVDRDDARDQVNTAARRAAKGDARVVMIGGEPGIGKTRLAAEVARNLHAEGNAVLFGRCSEEPLLPYEPFVEALRNHASTAVAEDLDDQTVVGTGLLARFIPELTSWLPRPPDAVKGDAVTERLLLFEAVGSWLDAIADAHGFVTLVVDDLHWADPSTLQLLSFLAHRTGAHHLLVIGTFRETEVAPTDRLGQLLADLRRRRVLQRVSLRGLDPASVTDLIEALGHEAPATGLAEVIRDGTDGNPFFIEEVLLHLGDAGVLTADSQQGPFGGPLDAAGIPEGVREVIDQRLTRLGDGCRTVLAVAAVCGRSFTLDVVVRVGRFDVDEVLDACDDAVASRLVVEEAGLPGRYRFAHALVRRMLYDELSRARRAVMHGEVADAVEALDADHLDDQRGTIAHHRLEAAAIRGTAQAIDAARVAAIDARHRYAHEESIAWYERARDVVRRVAPVDHGRAAELSLRMAELAQELDDATRTIEYARDAAHHARSAGEHALIGEAAWRMQFGTYVIGMTNAEVVELCHEALVGLEHPDDASVRAHVLACLAYELAGDDPERSERCAREAIALARIGGDPASVAPAAYVYAHTLDAEGRVADALDVLDEGLAAAIACDAYDLQLTYRMTRCYFALAVPDMQRYRAAREDLLTWVVQVRSEVAQHWAASLRVSDLLRTGELTQTRDALERMARPDPTMNDLVAQAMQIGTIHAERARYDELEALLQGAVAMLPAQLGWQMALALAMGHNGQTVEGRRRYDELVARGVDAIGRSSGRVGLILSAEACAFYEDDRHAGAIASLLEPYGGQVLMVGWQDCRGPVDLYLGMVRAVEGRLDQAVERLEAALGCSRYIESPRWTARTSYELARALRRRGADGDVERALALVAEALPVAESLDLRATAAMLETLA
jgi:tetratricopeptide (TPR) repeat protein